MAQQDSESTVIYQGATYSPARHFTAGRKRGGQVATIDTVVIHWTAGSGEGDDLARYLRTSRRASYHFGISRDGTVWQYVDTADTAWHAGPNTYRGQKINPRSIGIALCNRGPVLPSWSTANPDRVHHGPHPRAGFPSWQAFETYTDQQRAALVTLLTDLKAAHPTLDYAIGHEDCEQHKGDPGPALTLLGIPWTALGYQREHRDWTAPASAPVYRPGDRPLPQLQAGPASQAPPGAAQTPAGPQGLGSLPVAPQGAAETATSGRRYLGPWDVSPSPGQPA